MKNVAFSTITWYYFDSAPDFSKIPENQDDLYPVGLDPYFAHHLKIEFLPENHDVEQDIKAELKTESRTDLKTKTESKTELKTELKTKLKTESKYPQIIDIFERQMIWLRACRGKSIENVMSEIELQRKFHLELNFIRKSRNL